MVNGDPKCSLFHFDMSMPHFHSTQRLLWHGGPGFPALEYRCKLSFLDQNHSNSTEGSCSAIYFQNPRLCMANLREKLRNLHRVVFCPHLEVHVVGGVDGGGHAVDRVRNRHPSPQLRVIFDVIHSARGIGPRH